MELLAHPVAGVRRWTVRLLGDDQRMNRDLRARLIALAAGESDAMVRGQLASSCQRWKADDAIPILARLVRHDADLEDPYIPNQLWWAFERQLRQDREAVIDCLSTSEVQRTPLVRDAILERVARALASDGSDERLRGMCPTAGDRAGTGAGRADPVRDGEGARGAEAVANSGAARGAPGADLGRGPARPGLVLIRLAARLGIATAIEAAAGKARDPRAAGSDRIAMIELLGQLGRTEDVPVLIEILGHDPSPAIQLAAVAALGSFQQASIAPALAGALSVGPRPPSAPGSWDCSAPDGSGRVPCWMRSSAGRSPPRT